MSSKQYCSYIHIHLCIYFIFSWRELSLQSIIDGWKVAFGNWPWGKKEVEDYDKKAKTVMVSNSTNINHHSLNTKKKGGAAGNGNAGHGLGHDKWKGSEKMHCNRVHQWPL